MISSSLKKWISEETSEEEDLFNHCREMELVCYGITKVVLDADNKWKGNTGMTNNSHSLSNRRYIMELVNIQVLDQIIEYLSKVVKSFYKLNPKLARLKRDNGLLVSKHDHMFDKLCSRRFVMLQAIHGLIVTILNTCLHREDSRKLIESCLSLVSTYNHLLGLSYKKFVAKFNIGSNTYPTIISETKTLTLTKIVQVLAKSRAETNCQRLINCLVTIYTPEDNSDSDSGQSSAGSLEIYHTLTKHITPPASSSHREMSVEKRREAFIENKKNKMKQAKSLVDMKNEHNKMLNEIVSGQNSDADVPYTSLLTKECALENIFCSEENVNGILQSEEIYIEILLDTVAHMSPNLLGTNGVKKLKSGRIQASKKAAHKVTEYYQNILWGDVGSYLEHILLWWSSYPLATRSPNSSQNLREWLFQTFSANSKLPRLIIAVCCLWYPYHNVVLDTPDLVLSALRVLADSLGCHVLSTSWDKHFGATLTTNLKPTSLKLHPDLSVYVSECTESGAAFALMLQELVTLNNQCEVTWDYILGAPIEDLPIVEQIPILHRLDHSIHTYRLWCLAETRRLANLWEMDDFFRIAQNDMQACMEQLVNLRFADHSVTIEAGKIGVHENVCAKMREKLVSEVKVNIKKLKDATEEITAVLSSVCATTSLAHLTMIFPSNAEWRRVTDPPLPEHSTYVHEFLGTYMILEENEYSDEVFRDLEQIERLDHFSVLDEHYNLPRMSNKPTKLLPSIPFTYYDDVEFKNHYRGELDGVSMEFTIILNYEFRNAEYTRHHWSSNSCETAQSKLHTLTVNVSLSVGGKMLLPVIQATEDITTLNMVLRIMCESWLHHIYVAKVKFSKDAAVQLLADFNEVKNWLNACKPLSPVARKQMLQNEVLRRCEGVGRLLLHAPGDLISMQDSTMQSAQQIRKDENDAPEQLMPAEMYVPNQKQWLTLRAKKLKGPLAFTLCCVVLS